MLFLPMIPEIVVAMMALAKVGAILTPLFSGFGPEAVAARLADCEARFLVTADGFCRRGKEVPMKAVADRAVEQVPSMERVVVVRRAGIPVAWDRHLDIAWDEVLAMGSDEYPTRRTSVEDPFMIIYTSGTTGRPKGAVHVHAGFPLKSAQDLAHAFDLQEDDRLFWFTDMGWIRGPWMVLGMAVDLVDEEGRPVRGGVGELVLRAPWPGQTSGFWGAPERYLETYWSRLPGLWVHGDWARLAPEGFWYLEGRSNDTLKVAGKRIALLLV